MCLRPCGHEDPNRAYWRRPLCHRQRLSSRRARPRRLREKHSRYLDRSLSIDRRRACDKDFGAVIVQSALSLSMEQQQPTHRLLGTWRLVSVIREEVPSGAKIDLLGPDPKGFPTYLADGRMMVMVVRGDR